jgi:NAD(P)-dependent dehydrogenase (short-subunit alcohol dehydrogenase family)
MRRDSNGRPGGRNADGGDPGRDRDESLQMEVEELGIRVVVIDPGGVDTEITAHRKLSRGCADGSPYGEKLREAMRVEADNERKGWKVQRMAGYAERLAAALRGALPDRLFLRILSRAHGIKRVGNRVERDI